MGQRTGLRTTLDNKETLGSCLKLQQLTLILAEQGNKLCHRAVPNTQPDHFGWRPIQEAQLSEIAVLGDDGEIVPCRVLIDLRVGRVVQSKTDHVFGTGKRTTQGLKEASWEILVEKKLHP